MNHSKTFKMVRSISCLNVFLIVTVAGCGQEAPLIRTVNQPLTVNVVTLKQVSDAAKKATYFGVIVPNRSLTPGFSVPGTLRFVAPRGQVVPAGQVLASLDVANLENQKRLLQNRISQSTSQQQVQQLQVQLDDLDRQIEVRSIIAPFDCIIDEIYALENGAIQPQTPVLKILESGDPVIDIVLPSRVARFVDSFPEIYFSLDDKYVVGTLSRKSRIEKAGGVACRFDIESDLANVAYRFGQTVSVGFNFQLEQSGYWVPLTALQRSGEGVWSILQVESVDDKSMVARKLVTIIQINEDQALVTGNLAEGTEAIADGVHRVVPGQQVLPQRTSNGGTTGAEDGIE